MTDRIAELPVAVENTDPPQNCSCHPDNRPPVCQREHATTHCQLSYARVRIAELEALLASAGSADEPALDTVSRADVLRICKELGEIELDYILEGLPENARTREAAEAMSVRIRTAVSIMPSSNATPHASIAGRLLEKLEPIIAQIKDRRANLGAGDHLASFYLSDLETVVAAYEAAKEVSDQCSQSSIAGRLMAAVDERDMFLNPESLEQAADEIDCCPDCDHTWHEYDTNAGGCHASEKGDYCPNDVAETLRAIAKVAHEARAALDDAKAAGVTPEK
jgi:hypothetical protein